MKTTGVIVARFQTPYLHEGHKYLIDEIRSKHNKVVVVLGVSPVKGSRRNPFDFYTREKLLKQYAPELVVLPLSDHPSDNAWSQQLDKLLASTFPMEMFMLYGSRGSFIPYYSGSLSVQALPELGDHSATHIRDENADKVLDSADFRLGINYAYHTTYPKVYATVDVAVINETTKEVLLGKKPNAAEWRFPGGFSDPEDESFEVAARRELSEECGDIEVQGMQYIGSARINDWRYKNETDKIISLFFKTKFIFGTPKASDDLAALSWFPLSELQIMKVQNKITPEHHVLIDLLLNK
ncbi:NUDIX domain-containing protein [Pseudoflavitalea rhizosphaerae]|uniref:NUDIX domain-containing protein n=1 Tax=Pseudoflavitalea rhizosphaerae TaxID=1884793 RepID=UPI000F8E13A7|nr:NUDIX domain-containing protein [Pseudoflavitalea rhizosphaerae]